MFLCVSEFFFFKQKSAYEMRISDWSSDVCSSDLSRAWAAGHASAASRARAGSLFIGAPSCKALVGCQLKRGARRAVDMNAVFSQRDAPGGEPAHGLHRSEEHTSELQSLMRHSYAVFCLKKKKNKNYNMYISLPL